MKKKVIILFVISLTLLATNLLTIFAYNYQIADLREQSSFVEIANGEESFKKCLDKVNIENKFKNGKILIREVDGDQAIDLCS